MKSKLTKLFTLLTILTLGITNLWGATTTEVYFVKAADNTGTQSTIFTGAPSDGGNLVATFTVDGTEYSSTRRTSNGQFSITFTLPSDKTARLWAVHNQSGRHFALSGSTSGSITAVTSNTGFSCSTSNAYADVFDISSAETYTLSNSQNIGLVCLILKIEDAGGSGGGEDPVCPSGLSITSKNDKTAFMEGDAVELTASLSAGNGTITYQWYKGGTAEGNKLTGKTTNKLQIASCTTADAGDYFCVASKTSCDDAVNASAFAITVAADTKCFNMPAITSKPSDLASVTVTGGTLSDVSTAKAVAMNANGLKLDGNSVYLKVTLTNASIVEGTKITVAWKGAGSGAGIAVVNGDLAEKVIDETDVEAAGSATHTFTAAEAANYADEFIIHRNASGTGIYVNAITVEDCGPAIVKHTVTLNYNDGETPAGSLTVVDGNAAVKPADPTRGKYTFLGWFVGDTDNEYVWSTAVTDDITLKAHWQDPWTITFDSNGGSAVADITVKHNTTAEKPADPTWDGHDFNGWTEGVTPFDWTAAITADHTLVANWIAEVAKYDVEYYDGDTKIGTEPQVRADQHPTAAGITTDKPLYSFDGWFLSSALTGEPVALNTVTPSEGLKLYGKWTKLYATSYDMEAYAVSDGASLATLLENLTAAGYAYTNVNGIDNGHTHNYIYDGMKYKTNDGDLSFNVNAGKLVIVKTGNLPANALTMYINGVADPTVFVGANEAVETHVNNYFYSAAEALYRLDIQASKGTCAIKAVTITNPYTVSFEAHGDADPADMQGTPSVNLPTPTNGTASFLGWFDAETGGNKIGEAGETYTPTANITLHAQWEAVSTDTRIKALTYTLGAAAPVDIYEADKNTFNIALPYAQAYDAITVAATPNHASATIKAGAELTVSSIPGTATFTIVAQSGAEENYTVNFTKGPKDGVEIIGAVVTGNTTANVTGVYKGTASVKLNDKKIDKGDYYIYVTLKDGQTLQNGDILVVDVNTKSGIGTSALEICTGEGNLNNGILTSIAVDDYSIGENTIVLASVPAGATSIGLKRSDNLNAKINGLKVYRPMNPILTAIQFNDTKVDVTGTTVAATLPNGTNLGAMTITPTIVWNGAGTAVAANTWEWGVANTYTVTDKDGDATVYTITLTEAVPAVDPTLTYDDGAYVVGLAALDMSTLKTASNSDGEITYTVKDAGTTGATIDGNNFTATAAGTAIITASQAATVAYNAKTVDFNVVVTVATEIDGIKLVEADALTGKFVTASTLSDGAYTIEGINYAKYIKFNSSFSGSYGSGARNNYLIYDLKKENTTFHVYAHNNTSTAYKIVAYAYDDVNAKVAEVEVAANENAIKSFSLNGITKNTRVFIGVENNNIYFCQVVAVESGADLMKAGEPGYSIDFGAKSRFTAASGTAIDLDGMEFVTSSGYTPNSSTEVGLGTIGTNYVKFKLDAPTTVEVKTNSTNQYYIGSTYDADEATSKTYGYKPTSNGETHSFDLTAGTWYLNPNTSNIKLTKLAFSAPKCEKPTITTQPATKQTFDPGNLTATVVATVSDGGTLKYQWYKAADDSKVDGATEATLTITIEGTYYVIVTNTLADHSDNSVKSDNATLGYRVVNDATLSALSASAGTLDPAFDKLVEDYRVDLPEGTVDVPTLSATASMDGYANVDINNATEFTAYEAVSTVAVTAEDGITTKTYTVHFYVAHMVAALVDVTDNTTWDWTDITGRADGSAIDDSDGNGPKVKTEDGLILANYLLGGDSWDKIEGNNGAYAIRKAANKFYQGASLHMHTTKAGFLKISARNDGNAMKLKVEGNDLGSLTGSFKDYVVYVPAGDVTIFNEPETAGKPMRIQRIDFTVAETPDYTRAVSNNIGTLCVDHNVPAGAAIGATFYQLVGKEPTYGKLVFGEVTELEAGKPYIFESTTGSIALYYGETSVTGPVAVKGMIGSLASDDVTLPIDDENKTSIMYIANNKLWDCSDLVGTGLTVKPNRCYIDYSQVPELDPNSNPAPGRRYITVGKDGQNATTDVDLLNAAEAPVKMIIDGKMYILRGEKMYNANGQLVK